MTTAEEIQSLRRKFKDMEKKFDVLLEYLMPKTEQWVRTREMKEQTKWKDGVLYLRRKSNPDLVKETGNGQYLYNLTEFKNRYNIIPTQHQQSA